MIMEDTWIWFIEYHMVDLKMERHKSYIFITDKQKGSSNIIYELFPSAEHRHCVRNIYNNFNAKCLGEVLKQTLWNVARSTTMVLFEKHMQEIKSQSKDACKWFKDKNPTYWTRSHFKDIAKCDIQLAQQLM